MLTTNPFADLATSISPEIMQGYLILMVLLVVVGTMIDVIHKKSAQYFFENSKKQQKNARRTVSSGEKTSAAIGVVLNEVLTSGEFANPQRRLSHLLTMYGFIIFVISTITLIFAYPTSADAGMPVHAWSQRRICSGHGEVSWKGIAALAAFAGNG